MKAASNICSSVQYIHSRLSELFSGSQASFGIAFRDTSGYPESRNKLSEEGYWKEIHDLLLVSQKLAETSCWIYLTKRQLKIVKTIRANKKVLFQIFGPSKKMFIS
jgi:hypothetical protein